MPFTKVRHTARDWTKKRIPLLSAGWFETQWFQDNWFSTGETRTFVKKRHTARDWTKVKH
jgi:hypothetical protein